MLSNAVYDAYDRSNAAGWSRRIGVKLLRGELGFSGVTITDSLDGTAHARGVPTDPLAVRAARGNRSHPRHGLGGRLAERLLVVAARSPRRPHPQR
jgi:beta-glucosidase-like glycosyl hydrolase